MKKIILISLFLMFSCAVFADEIQYSAPTNQQIMPMKTIIETNENYLNNVLTNITFAKDEYIKITGNVSSYGTLTNFNIAQTNISDLKANSIIEKLSIVRNLQIPQNFDKFTLYLYSKPEYLLENTPVTDFYLYSTEMDNYAYNNKSQIQEYKQKIFYNKIYPNLVLLKNKNKTINTKPISIKVRISKNGTLLSAKIFKSSNDKIYDEEMLKLIKSSAPFDKFNFGNMPMINLMFDFNSNIDIKSKIEKNYINTPDKSYEATAKVILDERGNVKEATIAGTSNEKAIDDKIISAIQKTGNFFETINYDERNPFVKYIVFRHFLIQGFKQPIYEIFYYSPDDKSGTSQMELSRYARYVEYLVKSNWIPPLDKEKYSVSVLFIMNKTGKVTSAFITKSSNNKVADDYVLRAVYNAKLPPIPENFNSSYIPVEMTFDYEPDPNIDPILKELYMSK